MSLPLCSTFEFGRINNSNHSLFSTLGFKSNRRARINMGSSQSKEQSSSSQHDGSLTDGNKESVQSSATTAPNEETVQLSATATPNEEENSSASATAQEEQRNRLHRQFNFERLPSSVSITQTQYARLTSPTQPLVHYIFLVHGWLGNDLEYGYLSNAFQNILSPAPLSLENNRDDVTDIGENSNPDGKRTKRSSSPITKQLMEQQQRQQQQHEESQNTDDAGSAPQQPEIVVHSVKGNVGKTHDGIRNGGTRLANEMVHFIRDDVEKRLATEAHGDRGNLSNTNDTSYEAENESTHDVTFSIIGNSLGGLYSRYAVSLLPYQLRMKQTDSLSGEAGGGGILLNLHPNIFCTTATPHLGVSRHTYVPIPRIAEAIIGTGMGRTGRDLFRLNSEKKLASAEARSARYGVVDGLRRLLRRNNSQEQQAQTSNEVADNNAMDAATSSAGDDMTKSNMVIRSTDTEEEECIIRNMCLQSKFLQPLRNFRQRIAYANAYGTDFQVPTETAAFLHERSGVGHFVVASRDFPTEAATAEEQEKKKEDEIVPTGERTEDKRGTSGDTVEEGCNATATPAEASRESEVPPFIVAILRTEKQSQPQSPTKSNSDGETISPSVELLRMSQSLDSLGWTKVFIDVRDRIPVPRLAKPTWLRPKCGSLDDLIRERAELTFSSLEEKTDNIDACRTGAEVEAPANGLPKINTAETTRTTSTPAAMDKESCILTSQELTSSLKGQSTLDFPLGHTVMVANSKNEQYSKLNSKGRPVMDKLAQDIVRFVLEEYV